MHGGKEADMIYLDNAATTKTAPEVLEVMMPYLMDEFGNASALYGPGTRGKKAVNEAKRRIAETIGASMEEIYFTSGGTESDNWAIKGVAEACREKGRHIVTTRIEHHAVLHTCEYLEKQGYEVTYLEVDGEGRVSTEAVRRAIRSDTILISVMFANNEIGTIQPIKEIGAIAKEENILFHTDAVQAYGPLEIQVDELGIDLLSASGHKIGGPKGVGFLYVRNGVKTESLLHGGMQERGRRAGTENVPAIAGMAEAARLWQENRREWVAEESRLRDYLEKKIRETIPGCRINGAGGEGRLPGHLNMSFPGIEGESLLIMLDMKGICASSGSACTAGATEPSHVLTAIGLGAGEANGSLRLTVSPCNTMDEMDETAEVLREIVERLRSFRL